MFFSDQSSFQSWHFSLYQAFRSAVSVLRYLPGFVSDWLIVGLRLFFLTLLGFAAWVRSFSDTGFATWFIIALVLSFVVHAYIARPCFFPEEKCKNKEIDENVNEWLKNEVLSQKTVCDTLEQVRTALESKTRIELETEKASEQWKKQLELSQQVTHGLRRQVSELNNTKAQLESELHRKINENEEIKHDFAKNLDHLNETVKSVKSIEFSKHRLETLLSSEQDALKTLEDENAMLRATIDIMTKQRKTLVAKHATALKEVKQISAVKEELEAQIASNEYGKYADMQRIDGFKKLTKRLQTSISHAKGKLARVEDVLESESDRSRATTPRRALSPQLRQ